MSKYIHELKIGGVTAANNVFLAPLAGVADSAFRTVCREFGAGLVYSEMISAKGIHYGSNGSERLAEHRPIEEPFAVQIFGHEPEICAEAAAFFEKKGAKLIDINMGCPVPKVCGNHEGSFLLTEPETVYNVVAAVAGAVTIPVTVKMRRGFRNGEEVAPEIAKLCEAAGAAAVTVHGRFREQYYSGAADRGVVRRVKEAVRIPVIASGDIIDLKTAEQTFEETGCDGIMIGRGALGRPWIFEEIISGVRLGVDLKAIIMHHIMLEIEDKGEAVAIRELRKHLAWYFKGMRGAAQLKNEAFGAENLGGLLKILDKLQ